MHNQLQSLGMILIVDSSIEHIDRIRSHFEPLSYEVLAFLSPHAAANYLEQNPKLNFDLAFVEILANEKTQFDFLKSLKQSPHFTHVPVMAVSETSERSVVIETIDLGVAGYLLKPITPNKLTEIKRNVAKPSYPINQAS